MPILLLVLLLVACPALAQRTPTPPGAKDSAETRARLADLEFAFLMDWRYTWWQDQYDQNQLRKKEPKKYDTIPGYRQEKGPRGLCITLSKYDVDPHEFASHFVPDTMHNKGLCPTWGTRHLIDVDMRLFPDASMLTKSRDAAQKLRKPVIAAFDSAARKYPGDPWIAGQRVRLAIDQQDFTKAYLAAIECRAERWWCLALQGFVFYSGRSIAQAERAFDASLAEMPGPKWCEMSDLAELFPYTARITYQSLSCGAREALNPRIWWLADPLYLEPGNEREVEHYGRMMAIELRAANVIDGIYDWRAIYDSIPTRELVKRYGFPNGVSGAGGFGETSGRNPLPNTRLGARIPPMAAQTIAMNQAPIPTQKWRKFDTKSLPLGAPHGTAYFGPQFHTIPSWKAIQDPLQANDADWDLGPEIYDGINFDESWWAAEFYTRDAGPLFVLQPQTALFRRRAGPMIAVAAEWDEEAYHTRQPRLPMLGVATSFGPDAAPVVIVDSSALDERRALFVPVPSRRTLLGVEIVSQLPQGAAGRSRFAIDPPPPLSAMKPGELAISEPVLVHASENAPEPRTMSELLSRMFASTTLRAPTRIAVAWEAYGLEERDSVDVSIRIVRKADQGVIARAVDVVVPGSATEDSLVFRVRDPKPGDVPAFLEGAVPVRLRSQTLEISRLAAGTYTIEVSILRGPVVAATSRRTFAIKR